MATARSFYIPENLQPVNRIEQMNDLFRTERRRSAHGLFQTPPDLVVKFQPIDIVDVILQLIV